VSWLVMWSAWRVRGLWNVYWKVNCLEFVEEEDLGRVRIDKWKEKAQERNTWRLIVQEAKAHQGLQSWERRRRRTNLCVYVMAPEPISAAYFINSSHQSVCLRVSPYRC
jgi:hypothetical protein